MTTDDRSIREKRLIYRSWHRGTKELDLLLGPFAQAELAVCSLQELADYEALMELPEPLLYDLLTGKASAPSFDSPVLRRIHAFLQRPRA
jgi:antitoxin CptB